MTMRVRIATDEDLPEVVRIYNQSVAGSTATFDVEPVTVEARRPWLRRFDDAHPLFVCERVTGLSGFSYYLPYRPKAAYTHTKELTVYVDSDAQGRGVGSALMEALIGHAEAHGVHVLIAIIADGNPPSRALHEKYGFEKVGRLREVGWKLGRWVDTELYQKLLA